MPKDAKLCKKICQRFQIDEKAGINIKIEKKLKYAKMQKYVKITNLSCDVEPLRVADCGRNVTCVDVTKLVLLVIRDLHSVLIIRNNVAEPENQLNNVPQ